MARGRGMFGIPFITVDKETEKLVVHPEALRALRNWEGTCTDNGEGTLEEGSISSSDGGSKSVQSEHQSLEGACTENGEKGTIEEGRDGSSKSMTSVDWSLEAKPIAVVAGCGKSRVGKSTLLTRMMRAMGLEEGGFVTGSSTEPVTQGIWISPAPALVRGPSGEKQAVFFLDTEGTESLAQGRDVNEKLLSLAFLLSTVVLFNERGNLEANTFETLKMVADMCTRVKAHADCEANDAASLAAFTPHLFFLLRDATLELLPSKEEYLERQLELVPEGEPGHQWNEVRQRIRSMFGEEKRKLFSLSRPTGKRDIAHAADLDDDQMDEDFVEEFHEVLQAVLQVPFPAVLGSWGSESEVAVPGQPRALTGPVLAGLAEMYVDAMNAGGVPVIGSIQSNVHLAMCERYILKAFNHQRVLLCLATQDELKAEDELCLRVNIEAEEKFWEGARGLASAQTLEGMAARVRAELDRSFKTRVKLLRGGDTLEEEAAGFLKASKIVAVCFGLGGTIAGLALASIEAAALGVSLPLAAGIFGGLAMFGVAVGVKTMWERQKEAKLRM